MQINPVIVALAGCHAQPRVKAERRVERLGSLRYSDFNSITVCAFSLVRFRSGDPAAGTQQTRLARSRRAET